MKDNSLVGLILGIISLSFGVFDINIAITCLGIVIGIVGLFFSINSLKVNTKKSTTALILCSGGMLTGLAWLMMFI